MTDDDPATLTIAAVAGSALMAGGASVAGGMQAKQAAVQQGRQDTNAAKVAVMQAGAENSSETMNEARLVSRVEAGAAASGITQESATPILSEDYSQAKIKSAYTRFGGDLTSTEDMYAARMAKYQGNQAMWAGIFGAGKSVLGAASSIGSIGMSKGWGAGGGADSGGPSTQMIGLESAVR